MFIKPSKPVNRHHWEWFVVIATFCLVLFSGPVTAADRDNHAHHDTMTHDMKDADKTAPEYPGMFNAKDNPRPAADAGDVGVDERLGQILPADIEFIDETGDRLILGEFITRPTLILPVFYHCPKTCSLLLSNLARALNNVTFAPGDAYRVLAFSFDDEETPEDAEKAKKNYIQLLRRDFPAAEWRFLTGSLENIQSLTQAMGFKFKKLDAHSFVHPNILLCVASDRKIIRYLYGPDFLPFNISMAIAEAEKGTPGISIKKIVSLCFAYDPEGKRYVFRTFRISGILIITILAGFVFFLIRKNPADRGKNKNP